MIGDGVETLIRSAMPEDAPAIARVYVDAWRDSYEGILSARFLAALDVDRLAAMWRRRVDEDIVIVAEDVGAVVGFCSGGRSVDERDALFRHEIFTLYVHPRAQRNGIGAALLDDMRARMPAPILLWVLEQNPRAHAFYERNGGVPVRRGAASVGGDTYPTRGYAWFDVEG
jgi:ribosomal protein S18 acetylase RimI-like enzyme